MSSSRRHSLLDRNLREDKGKESPKLKKNQRDVLYNADEDPRVMALVSAIESDRIVKNGWLHKRNKAKQWSNKWFVLRDHQLMYYKDEQEYKVEGIVNMADVMTVAMVSDQHKPNHFVLFTSSANFHLRADSASNAQSWCDAIRQAADESAESLLASSFKRLSALDNREDYLNHKQEKFERGVTASNDEPEEPLQFPKSFGYVGSPGTTLEYSGEDFGGMSSCTSDNGKSRELAAQPIPEETENRLHLDSRIQHENHIHESHTNIQHHHHHHHQHEHHDNEHEEEGEQIVKKGNILRLKKRYNQWKRRYVILTTQRVVWYKSEKHKEPVKVIHLEDIIDVVETDPLSKSKKFCMMLITAEKRIRLCCESEDDLTKWLASFKTVIAAFHQRQWKTHEPTQHEHPGAIPISSPLTSPPVHGPIANAAS